MKTRFVLDSILLLYHGGPLKPVSSCVLPGLAGTLITDLLTIAHHFIYSGTPNGNAPGARRPGGRRNFPVPLNLQLSPVMQLILWLSLLVG